MLKSVLILPLMGMVALLITPRNEIMRLWKVGLEWSVLTLTGTILLWSSFDGEGQFKVVHRLEWMPSVEPGFGVIVFGVDGASIFFIILTALLIPICVLISLKSIKFLIKEFLLCLLFIEELLIGVFTVLDLVGFYILFEGILIPMFLIIGIWGSREEKIKASYYFFFYTFMGSVFMLLGIFTLYGNAGSTDYQILCCLKIEKGLQYLVFWGFFLSLAIKIPKMPFHIWLPQAHVEAPVAGSVILAGVLLKLGGYGFIRFLWALFPDASEYFSPLIMSLSLFAIIYGGLTTCRQVDLKRLIAYSSVAHMGLVTLGVFSHTIQGLVAAIFLMLAHGLVSSALFMAITFLYDRYRTRLIKYYRGMVITMPLFGMLLLILVLANASIPLSCSFIGEFLSLLAAFSYSIIAGLLASTGIVISAGYSIYVYNRVCFGLFSKYIYFSRDLNRREFYSLLPFQEGPLNFMAEQAYHPYHLVDPSPWPLIGACGSFLTTLGGVTYFHYSQTGLLVMGLVIIMGTMVVWWRDVIREGTYQGCHTYIVRQGLKYGMLLFILSEVCLFFSFFWSFFHSSLSPTIQIGAVWPPLGVDTLDPFSIPLLNTAILLSSGATVTWAHHGLTSGKRKEAIKSLALTVILGLIFTSLQGMEYYSAPFTISDSVYGSTFFITTGAHGGHVLIGSTFLLISLDRLINFQFTKHHYLGFEAAAWYWHFVDVVWLFLFIFMYWWGA